MGWVRCLVIADHNIKNAILETLKSHRVKLSTEHDGMVLFAYEGRYVVDFSEDFEGEEPLTLGVDGRNVVYYIRGNEDLVSTFNAYIELVVGFTIPLSDKVKLGKNAKAKKLLKKISGLGYDEENEDDDSYSRRFDIHLSAESAGLMKNLKEFAAICEDLGIEHRVALFDDSIGDVLGDFSDDKGPCIGPSACACAEWEVEGKTVSLIINPDEWQFDGSDDEWMDDENDD